MKKTIFTMLSLVFLGLSQMNAQVGIGTQTPNASAALEVQSTTQGLLPPRMTTAQRDAIANPAIGLTVFNTQQNCLNVWVGYWRNLCAFDNTASTGTITHDGLNYQAVFNPATGLTWLDRNLGATQVATSSTDANSYGHLYQWGRGRDGHEIRTSFTTTNLSTTDQPGNNLFILINTSPNDWRSPQNNNLWQGVSGINNPCPSGFRIPTEAELNAERQSWSSNSSAGAFASPLKLPAAGSRTRDNGSLSNVGSVGGYWSSAVSDTNARRLYFASSTDASMIVSSRAAGGSVRCIRN
jgi:uncharacterized protein (TIGR02145 family)